MEKLIVLNNVSKKIKNRTILDQINLEIVRGRSYGFIGYNGSGKSILFKMICGLSLPTTGSISFNGKTIGKDIDFIENAGVLIESPEFLLSYSGFVNLKSLAQIKNTITDDDIITILKKMNLYDARNKKVRTYSQGMTQRLRIAQAIMEKPEILILDEPMNSLDKDGVKLVREMLLEFLKSACK